MGKMWSWKLDLIFHELVLEPRALLHDRYHGFGSIRKLTTSGESVTCADVAVGALGT